MQFLERESEGESEGGRERASERKRKRKRERERERENILEFIRSDYRLSITTVTSGSKHGFQLADLGLWVVVAGAAAWKERERERERVVVARVVVAGAATLGFRV